MFHLFNDESILLSKMRFIKGLLYYLLFYEKTEITPTALNAWSKPESHNPGLLSKHNIDIKSIWKDLFKNIPRLSIDNKLRQVSFKIRYRILVTKKSYKDLRVHLLQITWFHRTRSSGVLYLLASLYGKNWEDGFTINTRWTSTHPACSYSSKITNLY